MPVVCDLPCLLDSSKQAHIVQVSMVVVVASSSIISLHFVCGTTSLTVELKCASLSVLSVPSGHREEHELSVETKEHALFHSVQIESNKS